jgi:DNA-directed RNA polymerase subunit F
MANIETISETPITMAELKDELKRIKKRDGSLNFRAEQTEDYLGQFAILGEKDAKALAKKLEDLSIPRLKSDHIVKLVDICPTNQDEVKMVLQGYALTVTKENIKKIADTILESIPAPKKEKVEKTEGDAEDAVVAEPVAEKKPEKVKKKKAEKTEEKAEEKEA